MTPTRDERVAWEQAREAFDRSADDVRMWLNELEQLLEAKGNDTDHA